MQFRMRKRRIRFALAVAGGAFVLSSSACMGYPMEGAVATPPPPGTTGESRLPSLLSQLQGAGAGMEVFDGTQNEVLGAQDGEAAGVTVTPAVSMPTATPTPPGDKGDTGNAVPTPVQTVAGANTPNPNPGTGSGGRNEGNPTVAATPPATPTPPSPVSEASPTPSPTPTTAPPTATPTPSLPPSETGSSGGLPPTEGG